MSFISKYQGDNIVAVFFMKKLRYRNFQKAKSCDIVAANFSKSCGKVAANFGKSCGKVAVKLGYSCGKVVVKLR